jgi:ATP/maltotriose-dependent transcriptional regulator MalT/DNA-binding SARP family transcriptional activator
MPVERSLRPKTPRLFAAKTRIPLPPPNLVSRARLLATLRAGLERKLTVIIAPAGFGKTTLVAELARELHPAAAWLALDPSDRDLSLFAHYLVEAIAQVRPGFGAQTRAWLAATPTPAAEIEDFVATLLAELEAMGEERLVLFLDDYHEVGASDGITHLLDLLLRYLPPQIHLVVSSRAGPAFTTTRLLVQQQITGLGTEELRFTVAEAESWLAVRPVPPDPDQAQRLIAATEGWITGMILQSAAGSGVAQVGLPSGQLYDYLSSEVLAHQPPDIQHFLQRAAVLAHLTVPLCAEVLGVPNAAEMLRRVYEQPLFLTAASGREAPHYRLHQLFREFLAVRLRTNAPDEFVQLHRRAARYFEQQGEVGQAMEHLIAVENWDAAAALAGRVGTAELEAGRIERVERWISQFPLADRQRRAGLLLLETRLLAAQSQYPAASEVLDRAERLVLAAEDRAGLAEVLGLKARLAAARADGRQMVTLAQQALAIPEASAATRAHAQHAAAIGYAFSGDSARADQAFAAAKTDYAALGDVQNTAVVSSDWGYALVLREDFPRAADQLNRALEYTRLVHNSRLQALVLCNLAAVHQAQGELVLAEEHLRAALAITRQLRWRRLEAENLLGLAEIVLDSNRAEAALLLYQEAADLARRGVPGALGEALAGQARVLRRQGRYTDAGLLARQGLDVATNGPASFQVALCRLECGATTLVHAPEEALPLLHEARQVLVRLGRKRAAARAAAVLATALFAVYEYGAAEAMLEEAYLLAGDRGSAASLVPELATVYGLPLLRRADNGGRYARLLAAVARYLEAEYQEAANAGGAADGVLQIVRDRPHILEVYTLGQANVYRDGTPLSRADWQTTTAKELFFYFVEHPEGRRKEVILAALWPDQSYSRANDNFHTSMRRLRSALGMDMIRVDDNVYRLNPALPLWHDGTEAQILITRAHESPDGESARRWQLAAADLLNGTFAEEFYRDWAGARRQFWETRTREVLTWLVEDALERDAPDEAVAWGQRLLALDPLDEAAHVLLLRIYGAAGRSAMLTQQYNALCRMMEDELGAQPSRPTRELYQRLLQAATGPARRAGSQ